MPRLSSACPLLAAPNPGAAARWYCEKLGFCEVVTMDGYAIVERDGAELHFWQCDDRHIAENTSAYIRVDDIDTLRLHLTKAAEGGRISNVESRDWGMREFYVWDPAGNLLRFGERIVEPEKRSTDHLGEMIEAFAALPKEEQDRQLAVAETAIREGRL